MQVERIENKYFTIKNNFIICIIAIFLFGWDYSLEVNNISISLRYSILLLSFLILKNFLQDIKNKNFNFLIFSILIFFF